MSETNHEIIAQTIRNAFSLMGEINSKYKPKDVDIENKAALIVGPYSEFSSTAHYCGIPTYVDNETGGGFRLVVHDPSHTEKVFLSCFNEAYSYIYF